MQSIFAWLFYFDFPARTWHAHFFAACIHLDNDEAKTQPDTPVTIPVLNNDKDSNGSTPGTVNNVTQPNNGEVVIQPDDTVDYTPDPGFVGRDCFTYEICDSSDECDTGRVPTAAFAPPPHSSSGVRSVGTPRRSRSASGS